MNASKASVSVCVLAGLLASTASAVNIETVPVGNPGNEGENSGASGPDMIPGTPDDGYGPDRICGAVDYTYNIGKYEVTAGQYTEFLNKVAATDTYGLYSTNMDTAVFYMGCNIKRTGTSGSYTYSVAADWANRPVNFVSWGDAARFSNWLTNGQPTGPQSLTTTEDGAYNLGGTHPYYNPDGSINDYDGLNAALMAVTVPNAAQRSQWAQGSKPYFLIPREDEWYKAAYYRGGSTNAGYFDYPTSSDTAPGQDMADVSGNNANYYTAPYAYPIDSGKYTTVVGEFQNSDSPYGTFDQGGNVWEWNEAIVTEGAGYSSCGFRGGSFWLNDYGPHASIRISAHPTYQDDFLGFRVVKVPEPATVSLLALGGLGVLRRRGRLAAK